MLTFKGGKTAGPGVLTASFKMGAPREPSGAGRVGKRRRPGAQPKKRQTHQAPAFSEPWVGISDVGAGNRTRTCMVSHWNLNPACLPIPPCPQIKLHSKRERILRFAQNDGSGKNLHRGDSVEIQRVCRAAAPRCFDYHSMKAAICQSKGAGFGGGGRDDNRRRPYGEYRRGAGRPLKDLLRCGGRRPLRRKGPGFVIARAGTARGNPFPSSPF